MTKDDLEILARINAGPVREEAREKALNAAMVAFDATMEEQQNSAAMQAEVDIDDQKNNLQTQGLKSTTRRNLHNQSDVE